MESLKAGRELDVMVAEKVMGWNWYPVTEDQVYYSEEARKRGGFWRDGIVSVGCTTPDGSPNCPAYSTDIAAAWEVVEHMQRTHWRCAFSLFGPDEEGPWTKCWRACFSKKWAVSPDSDDIIVCDTAPHAICLAALKAVGAI